MAGNGDGGFIKISRRILNWGWYGDINTFRLFFHCLLKANWKKKEWNGREVQRGQFVTSLSILSQETGLTIRQTRTALEHLILTGELTNESSRQSRIITVNNYDKYQGETNGRANERQTNGKRNARLTTTTKEYKEYIEEKKEEKKSGCAAKVPPPGGMSETAWEELKAKLRE